jgi:hypothetical protein
VIGAGAWHLLEKIIIAQRFDETDLQTRLR